MLQRKGLGSNVSRSPNSYQEDDVLQLVCIDN